MSRLLGILTNRSARLRSVLADPRLSLHLPDASGPSSWGLVFFQGDEVLHKKRPLGEGESSTAARLVGDDVLTDCAVLQYDQRRADGFRPQDVGPFRFRRWAFAATGLGELDGARRAHLSNGLPDFLQRTISGRTCAEALFARLLAGIHETGRLDDGDLGIEPFVESIRTAVDRLGGAGAPEVPFAFVLTNGVRMVGASRGRPLVALERITSTESRPPSPRGPAELRSTLLLASDAAAPGETGTGRVVADALALVEPDLGVEERAW